MIDQVVWAKSTPYKSLRCHLRETAIVSQVIFDKCGYAKTLAWAARAMHISINQLRSLISYLCAVHDIGKTHPVFSDQEKCKSAYDYFEKHLDMKYPFPAIGYRHELGSKWILTRIWNQNKLFGEDTISDFSSVIALHHQGKEGRQKFKFTMKDDGTTFAAAQWIAWQNTIEAEMRERFHPPTISDEQFLRRDSVCMAILGIIILSDWIASSKIYKDTNGTETDEELSKIAAKFLDDNKMVENLTEKNVTKFADLWKPMTEGRLRPMQAALEKYLSEKDTMPIMLMLEAPMGEGKTEAALFAAFLLMKYWDKTGFYDALPTAGTSNQMIDRINEMLKQNGLTDAELLHSMAWMKEDNMDEDSEAIKWFSSSRMGLFSNAAVGTIDQAMMAVLRTKYGVLRLTGLENKVLIIDEIHSYDAYMSTIIDRLLEWCREMQIPVIMLSATLPVKKKEKLLSIYQRNDKKVVACKKAYPLITAAYQDGRIDQVPVDGSHQKQRYAMKTVPCLSDPARTAKLALSKIQKGGNVCVIMNTIKDARAVYEEVKKLNETLGDKMFLILFHSRYTAGRRAEIEDLCIEMYEPKSKTRPKRSIVIATQVLEQSINVDFDYVISAIAPIDLLLQRAGREARSKETMRPIGYKEIEFIILIPRDNESYGGTEYVYYKALLDRTKEILNTINHISVPLDIPEFVNRVYTDEIDPKELDNFMNMTFSNQLAEGQAEQIELRAPSDILFGLAGKREFYDDEDQFISAATRLGSSTIRIAVIPDKLFHAMQDETSKGYVSKETALNVMKYVCSIPEKEIKKAISEIDEDKKIVGIGRLYGINILCADQEDGTPSDTLYASINNYRIICDREIGAYVSKRAND